MSANVDEKYYLAVIAAWCNWEYETIAKLREFYDGTEKIWNASNAELRKILKPKMFERFQNRANYPIDKFKKNLEELEIKIISIDEEEYPVELKEIADPPVVIYVKGELYPDEIAVGIVGSRNASGYGRRMADRISSVVAKSKVAVVSGLALGIDGVAHEACLKSGGRTIAVLANGLDFVYPYSHRGLAKKILDSGGVLVSEYPPKTEPLPHHFLARNRIIAGLSKGVVIVEANERSGALVTARLALDYNKVVFAVPGDAERPQSAGVNNLIKQGAIPITRGEDMLDELGIEEIKAGDVKVDGLVGKILEHINKEPKHVDILAREIGLSISELNGVLMEMEIEGLVKNAGGMQYIRE